MTVPENLEQKFVGLAPKTARFMSVVGELLCTNILVPKTYGFRCNHVAMDTERGDLWHIGSETWTLVSEEVGAR